MVKDRAERNGESDEYLFYDDSLTAVPPHLIEKLAIQSCMQ